MKIYKTIQGDMWDFISYKVYGSEQYTNELFKANPDLQHVFVFSANQTIYVPEINVAIEEQLPPWLRNNTEQAQTQTQSNELSDILNSFDGSMAYILSYRFVDRYTRRVREACRFERRQISDIDQLIYASSQYNYIVTRASKMEWV